MPKTIRPLPEYFVEIVDPRLPKGLRHALVAILCLCVVALTRTSRNQTGNVF
jgi:hypothetical protein